MIHPHLPFGTRERVPYQRGGVRVGSLLLLLSVLLSGQAQTPSVKKTAPLKYGTAAKAGMSEARLARIDDLCRKALQEDQLPGIVALVARHGVIVYHKAFGMADPATERELKRDDIFRIASQTKAVTATAVMMLWEDGKFRLDDPISMYIPEFKNPKILKTYSEADGTYTTEPAKSEITIRHLLSHTSGLGYGEIDGDPRFKEVYRKAGIVDAFSSANVTIGENVKKLARLPLHHNPGEKFTYAEGLDVLGYLIEIVSGLPFDQFLALHVFQPLQMKDSYFYLPYSKAPRLVPVLTKTNGKWVRQPVTFYDPDYPIKGAKAFFAGGAGLSSTATDYAALLQMYLNRGEYNGVRLLSRTTIDTILANQTGELFGGKNSDEYFSLAFGVLNEAGHAKGGKGSTGTFQWGGYFNTQYFADPKEQVVGVLMKQTQGIGERTGDMFRQLVFQAIDN